MLLNKRFVRLVYSNGIAIKAHATRVRQRSFIQLLEVKSKLLKNNISRIRRYYYSPELKVDPEWFAENQNGNFNEIYRRMKSIPLKIVDDFGTFKITYEATEIIPKKLDDTYFQFKREHLTEMK